VFRKDQATGVAKEDIAGYADLLQKLAVWNKNIKNLT
tara:strand:- start:563 stop:673 length:111 start_codon:yes stop_codon:yes gene_type:complete